MATVTVLRFSTSNGARSALEVIQNLPSQRLIEVIDAAIVSWPAGRKSPATRQLVNLRGAGTMSATFWGLLFGLIFVGPLFGMAFGAALGALGGAFRDYGIGDEFIYQVRSQVKEGASALFLMTTEAVMDRVVEALSGVQFEIIATDLSQIQERQLREAFKQAA